MQIRVVDEYLKTLNELQKTIYGYKLYKVISFLTQVVRTREPRPSLVKREYLIIIVKLIAL